MGRATRLFRLAIPATVISLAALAGPWGLGAVARAQASVSPIAAVPAPYTVPNGHFTDVAAASPDNAWAVGFTQSPNGMIVLPLLVHWNGRAWSQMAVPGVQQGDLYSVTAVSAADVWAVGINYGSGPGVVILHWNGRVWSRVLNAAVSNPTFDTAAVAASAHEVWVAASNGNVAEFLHLTGGRWYVVPANLPKGYQVTGIAMVSSKLAWAAGDFQAPTASGKSFLARWNGSVWERVADPIMADGYTNAVASGPGGVVWVAGDANGGGPRSSMWWDGKSWHQVKNQSPGIAWFWGLAFIPGGTVWAAVMPYSSSAGGTIAQWTGSAWKQVTVPGTTDIALLSLAGTSVRNVWAVGVGGTSTGFGVILHWNGKTWS